MPIDADALQKLFAPFAAVSLKGMFGGRGVYAHGVIFALQAGEKIYLKTDEASAPRFKGAGSTPFVYPTPMGPRETSYWTMPAAAFGDPDELKMWCGLALEAARRRAAVKSPKPTAAKVASTPPKKATDKSAAKAGSKTPMKGSKGRTR
jgi:DNA transformation protein and related proteins